MRVRAGVRSGVLACCWADPAAGSGHRGLKKKARVEAAEEGALFYGGWQGRAESMSGSARSGRVFRFWVLGARIGRVSQRPGGI